MTTDRKSQLKEALEKITGKENADKLYNKYIAAFPAHILEDNPIDEIAKDITYGEHLSAENPLEIYFDTAPNGILHLKIFQFDKLTPLSEILPIFEKLGLYVVDKNTYHLVLESEEIWISDFTIKQAHEIDVTAIEPLFREAIIRIWDGKIENDGFNSLILKSKLNWKEVTILRSYAKYWLQLGCRFSQNYLEQTLLKYPEITKSLVALFIMRFQPTQHRDDNEILSINKAILTQLDAIESIDEDRILRMFLTLINATVRTNYFQEKIKNLPYLSIKFDDTKIPDLSKPSPEIETFVYSPRFEAIHLRSSKIARGGIRWSERCEDFRTEVLGLMRTQTVKNAIIVPTGAKGGFVLKHKIAKDNLKALQEEAITCYKMFISGLLDITDNHKDKKITTPDNVVAYDGTDPYLVVAADKGTAGFSDIANELSKKYDYWLGDAFASGGVTGYNHKSMGITSRGAWESVKRHFHELNKNIEKEDFTAMGIGDMSGDVFGNGMLLSRHTKLIAAFDHRDIFIDPNPDPEKSYEERLRLFKLPRSSWEDYNKDLISKGGGIFKRTEKVIHLSEEIKQALDISANELSPTELIQSILKAPIELFWNGGIGTFVKSSHQSHEDAADNTNRYIRINANELRCKVVGEGGNLGFTQLARIEYAAHGGKINTDFIDNVGGVDCSDREVNIKIGLNVMVAKNSLTEENRNKLLQEMTDEVSHLVLTDAYDQALAISLIEQNSILQIESYQSYVNELEDLGLVDRSTYFLPDDEEFLRRKAAKRGLYRPEIAMLLAITKIMIKKEILESEIPDDPYLNEILIKFFPKKMHSPEILAALKDHQLRKEIIATQLSNELVNTMGIVFIHNIKDKIGSTIPKIVQSYIISRDVYKLCEMLSLIESLDGTIPVSTQYEMYARVQELMFNSTLWFLRNEKIKDMAKQVEIYGKKMDAIRDDIPDLMAGNTRIYMKDFRKRIVQHGLPDELAKRIAGSRALYSGLNIINVTNVNHDFDVLQTAKIYFGIGEYLKIVWFRDHLFKDISGDYWDALARTALRDELDVQQRNISTLIMKSSETDDVDESIKSWMKKNSVLLKRWDVVLTNLQAVPRANFTMFFIAVYELGKLTQKLINKSQ